MSLIRHFLRYLCCSFEANEHPSHPKRVAPPQNLRASTSLRRASFLSSSKEEGMDALISKNSNPQFKVRNSLHESGGSSASTCHESYHYLEHMHTLQYPSGYIN
jgi:hypothetical protein